MQTTKERWNDLFGDVIDEYTVEQAIEDGELIHPYPNRWRWLLITRGIHEACTGKRGRTYDQCLVPLLMDCIMLAQDSTRHQRQRPPLVLEGTVAGTVWVVPNDKGGMTVMWPEED
jgi:hypothetical protein